MVSFESPTDHLQISDDLVARGAERNRQALNLALEYTRLTKRIARNNMRAMRKGDLAFFYHSNTKVPGIAGVMEIVREHTTDGNRPFSEGA